MARGVAAAVSALEAGAELDWDWVPGVCSAEHTALAVVFQMVRQEQRSSGGG